MTADCYCRVCLSLIVLLLVTIALKMAPSSVNAAGKNQHAVACVKSQPGYDNFKKRLNELAAQGWEVVNAFHDADLNNANYTCAVLRK